VRREIPPELLLLDREAPFRRLAGGGEIARFVEDPPEHLPQLRPLIAQGAPDDLVQFQRGDRRAARRAARADVEDALLEFALHAGGADVRQCRKGFDDENGVAFPVDLGALDREVDRRIDQMVDERRHRRGIEGVRLFRRKPLIDRRMSGRVLADADHQIPAARVRERQTVPDDLGAGGARHGVPVHRGLVVQFVGLHAAVNELTPYRIAVSHFQMSAK